MNTIIYFFMFAMGVVLGSFYTLAVYRIPLKQDITHSRSYCPKCNHKLNFWDLIPVLSYIFLGGKCRYCKEKIRPRYLIIEISSGLIFLLFAMLLDINILTISYTKIVSLFFGVLYLSACVIAIGIFKEYKKVQRSVFNFGIIVEAIYMVYLYILNTNIYRYGIYSLLIIFMAIANNYKSTNEKIKVISFIAFIIVGILQMSMALI